MGLFERLSGPVEPLPVDDGPVERLPETVLKDAIAKLLTDHGIAASASNIGAVGQALEGAKLILAGAGIGAGDGGSVIAELRRFFHLREIPKEKMQPAKKTLARFLQNIEELERDNPDWARALVSREEARTLLQIQKRLNRAAPRSRKGPRLTEREQSALVWIYDSVCAVFSDGDFFLASLQIPPTVESRPSEFLRDAAALVGIQPNQQRPDLGPVARTINDHRERLETIGRQRTE